MGNVLVHFSHERMCAQIGALCGQDAAEIRRLLLDSGLQWDFERGRLSETDVHERLQSAVGRPLEFDALLEAVSDIFWLNESIVPVVRAVQVSGRRVVLLSNTCITHLNWVRSRFDVLKGFDHLVASYEAGAVKPEPGIFQAALAAAQCDPHECFYTDDIPEYVATARTYGIDAEVYTDTPTLIAHLRRRGIDIGGV
ncbi:MAG: HAD family phosphatase [Planctomycetaceae bacterium]|nr:HAD family phosphatase [Planctomycetaceae bacterium]